MASQVPVDGADTLEEPIATLSKRIDDLLIKRLLQPNQRIMIALAGVPGSGKSTVSTQLLRSIRQRGVENVMVVPMVRLSPLQGEVARRLTTLKDGFHLPKKTLATFPCPETAFRRRGAPFTFDADAFVATVASLKSRPVTQLHDPELAVLLPSFDHAVQDPVCDDICVPSSTQVIIFEGNYLLFDESPWNKASVMFDEKYDSLVFARMLADGFQVVCGRSIRDCEAASCHSPSTRGD